MGIIMKAVEIKPFKCVNNATNVSIILYRPIILCLHVPLRLATGAVENLLERQNHET